MADRKAEIKQAVVNVERVKTTHLRVAGMHGKYKGILFDNNGVSDQPVPQEIREMITKQYPGAIIEEVDEPVF